MLNWQLIITVSSSTLILMLSILFLMTYMKNFKQQYDNKTQQAEHQFNKTQERLIQLETLQTHLSQLLREQQQGQQEHRSRFDQHQLNSLKILQDSLAKGMAEVRLQVSSTLQANSQNIGEKVDSLTKETQLKLQTISNHVDRKLQEGFEKTNVTFINVVERLKIIDAAQQRITELSGNIVSLQEVLIDKRSRGAFGEVQLNALIRNMLPKQHFSLQHKLSNGTRVDCILFLPEPTGNIAIDAKFPLESYQLITNNQLTSAELQKAKAQFKQDIRKHIKDIANKYIIPNETADGAMMFIPAEAIFAEIHSNYTALVEDAHKARVWLVSPTTMMAVLTTARAALKDAATRQQVHIIQEHLVALSKDFSRFQKRMDKLSDHINLAQQDVEDVHKSSRKITSRFTKIEEVDLLPTAKPSLEESDAH